MSKQNIIGIHMEMVSTDINYFVSTGVFRTIPQILYKVNDDPVREFHINKPIEIFRENMSYKDFKSIIKSDNNNSMEFMTLPGKAYDKMQYYINKNSEKVLSDMVTAVIVKIIKELGKDAENIFFINNRTSNKLIGRLGYMYLDSDKNTFCFVSYKQDNLLTNAMRNGSSILEFDIGYFNRNKDKEISDIVPNDFMESMTQTVFFAIKGREESILPLRCDIFSQGITNREIQKKVHLVHRVLSQQDNLSQSFKYSEESERYVRIPYVLYESIEAVARFRSSVRDKLEEY